MWYRDNIPAGPWRLVLSEMVPVFGCDPILYKPTGQLAFKGSVHSSTKTFPVFSCRLLSRFASAQIQKSFSFSKYLYVSWRTAFTSCYKRISIQKNTVQRRCIYCCISSTSLTVLNMFILNLTPVTSLTSWDKRLGMLAWNNPQEKTAGFIDLELKEDFTICSHQISLQTHNGCFDSSQVTASKSSMNLREVFISFSRTM